MAKAMQWDHREEISLLLYGLRRRLATDTRFLGKHKRLPCRVGRPVSQEELAEAVGVSRGWYALLERGAAVQPSLSMLDRLAEALHTTAEERMTLFCLAIPAFKQATAIMGPQQLCSSCRRAS